MIVPFDVVEAISEMHGAEATDGAPAEDGKARPGAGVGSANGAPVRRWQSMQ